jgi:hypothetical protein
LEVAGLAAGAGAAGFLARADFFGLFLVDFLAAFFAAFLGLFLAAPSGNGALTRVTPALLPGARGWSEDRQ